MEQAPSSQAMASPRTPRRWQAPALPGGGKPPHSSDASAPHEPPYRQCLTEGQRSCHGETVTRPLQGER